MRVLVACEESQAVTIEMRRLGHEAYSCDIIDQSGGHPEWHIKQDVRPLLDGHCSFETADGVLHTVEGKWDMIIAFPPCTFLTITGNRWFDCARYGSLAQIRWNERCKAICFFVSFFYANCDRVAIENPVGVMSSYFRKPTQVVQPWQFAESEDDEDNLTEKTTCLWLKGLQPLNPRFTEKPDIPYHEWVTPDGRKKRQTMWYYKTRCLPHAERASAASKTFPGIAKAMAEQWAGPIAEEPKDNGTAGTGCGGIGGTGMERLSERLQDVVHECIDSWSQIEEDIVTAAIKRLAAYEDTGVEPEGIKQAFNEEALLKLASQYLKTTPERLRELAHAEQEDRLLVLDEETALAIAAGAHGCNTNKRLFGASYMRNFRSDNPQSISYYRAIEILIEIAEKALEGGSHE